MKKAKAIAGDKPSTFLKAGYKVVHYSAGSLLLQKGADLRLFHLTEFQDGTDRSMALLSCRSSRRCLEMSVRRLAEPHLQPKEFSFTAENRAWADKQIAKYPDGRQQSAVIPLLWRAQEQAGGWLPQKAIEYVAELLGMANIRVLEVATFYTMFNLAPVGKFHVQLCGTTPCMLRGAERSRTSASAGSVTQHHPNGRQVLLDRGRVPRRLRQRADGADQLRLLRRPHAREFRENPGRSHGRTPPAAVDAASRGAAGSSRAARRAPERRPADHARRPMPTPLGDSSRT